MNGINYTTGTVHYAKLDNYGGLVQACGIRASQTVYLDATDAEVTCRKCVKPVAKAKRATPSNARFGRQEFTISELRSVAKDMGIKGYTKMDGNALLAEIVKTKPQFA